MDRLELDPKRNRFPDKIQTIHLIGVCGTAMGALAGMLAGKGFAVTGSDENVYPPMSDFLADLGIEAIEGFAPANLDHRPDLVVVGNVVTRANPESPRLKELGLPYVSFPQALRHFFFTDREPIVVAGTHGKTTTSSLIAWCLEDQGFHPGFMIGGILGNFGRNFQVGGGDWFVVEGDEYDTAFFDKTPKFIHYAPYLGILTSAEFDHADIYPDFDAVLAAFRQFTALIPPGGLLAAWGDSPVVRELAAGGRGEVIHYGLGAENHWRAVDLAPSGRRTRFQLLRPGRPPVTLQAPLPGRHNVLNTLAAAVILDRVGVPPEALASSLDRFQGVRRRQEVRGIKSGVTVIDDFAHHPTAVRETTAAVRSAYPDARLVAVFEPRSNTSLRSVFQDEYAEAFGGADLVLLRRPTHLFKAPENQRMDVDRLAADLVGKGLDARLLDDTDGLLDELTAEVRAGDVVLIMSNGGFDDIHRRLLDRL